MKTFNKKIKEEVAKEWATKRAEHTRDVATQIVAQLFYTLQLEFDFKLEDVEKLLQEMQLLNKLMMDGNLPWGIETTEDIVQWYKNQGLDIEAKMQVVEVDAVEKKG